MRVATRPNGYSVSATIRQSLARASDSIPTRPHPAVLPPAPQPPPSPRAPKPSAAWWRVGWLAGIAVDRVIAQLAQFGQRLAIRLAIRDFLRADDVL